MQLQDYQMEGEKPLNVDLAQQSRFLGPLVFFFQCSECLAWVTGLPQNPLLAGGNLQRP